MEPRLFFSLSLRGLGVPRHLNPITTFTPFCWSGPVSAVASRLLIVMSRASGARAVDLSGYRLHRFRRNETISRVFHWSGLDSLFVKTFQVYRRGYDRSNPGSRIGTRDIFCSMEFRAF